MKKINDGNMFCGFQIAVNLPRKAEGRYFYVDRTKKGIWGKIEGIDGGEILLPDMMMWQQS